VNTELQQQHRHQPTPTKEHTVQFSFTYTINAEATHSTGKFASMLAYCQGLADKAAQQQEVTA
jgi:hypothetical protein